MLKMISFLYQAELTSSFTQALTSALSIIQKKTSVCTYLSLLYFSFKVLWNFFQRSLSFLHPGELAVVSFPKASAKLHGLCELTKFFRKKFLEKFRRLSRKLRYAPYSHGFKAHKNFSPESAFLVPN